MLNSLQQFIAHKSRRKRAGLFTRAIRPTEDDRILDLGGGKGRHFARYFPFRKNVWISCHDPRSLRYAEREYGFNTILLDGTDTLPFGDKEFDVVFCSSVIEHVTGPKEDAIDRFKRDGEGFAASALCYQRTFASEICRVAKSYYVQTPNRHFPVEMHSWIPGISYLPTHHQWTVMKTIMPIWPVKDTRPDWSLLTRRQMQSLFPEAEIRSETLAGLVKSIIAIGGDRIGS